MSFKATSDAVNEVVEVMRAQVRRIEAALAATEDPESAVALEGRLLAMTDRLALIEKSRGDVIIALIAGRKGLDKLPAHEIEQAVKAITGVERK